ncbi:MAG: LPS-assembly protein LptD [Gammaproteobacteria bacterium]|nr:LPS-assembly protein LptD [Gammaproteobacteria bacterium]
MSLSSSAKDLPATASKDDKHTEGKAQKESAERTAQILWLQRELHLPASCLADPGVKSALEQAYHDQQKSAPPVELSADHGSSTITDGEQTHQLEGNVMLITPQLTLAAGRLMYNSTSKDFSASDKVVLDSSAAQFSATEVSGNVASGQAQLNDSEFRIKINGANGRAEQATVNEQQQVALTGLTFTTCPAGDDSWKLEAETLTVDEQAGWGEASDVTIKVADVPVLYLPWLKFPVDDRRHSGVLPPSFSDSERNGFDIELPIYFNLAPNYDLTLTPRYMVERGALLATEFRYLSEQQWGTAELEYLDDQKVTTAESNNRWLYRWQHQVDWNNGWFGLLDTAGVSDVNYLTDLGSGIGQTNRDQLTRRAELGYQKGHLATSIRWLQYQPLALTAKPMRILPQVELRWRSQPAQQGLTWSVLSQYSQFERDSDPEVAATQAPAVERLVTKTRVGYRWQSSWGYVEPAIALNQFNYQYAAATQSNLSESVNQYSIDAGLTLERPAGNGVHYFKPRFLYLKNTANELPQVALYDTYLPQFDYTRLFADNRYSGLDRINETEQFTIGLANEWQTAAGEKQFSVAIGQSFYRTPTPLFSADNSARKHSALVSQAVWYATKHLTLQGDLAFDPDRQETEQGRLSAIYEPSEQFVVNVSHRFVDDYSGFREQTDIGLALPISERWQIISRWQYDLLSRESLETMFGLEYRSCCWSLRLVSRRYLNTRLDENGAIIPDPDGRFSADIRFEFVLRGLGGGGQKSFKEVLNQAQWNY